GGVKSGLGDKGGAALHFLEFPPPWCCRFGIAAGGTRRRPAAHAAIVTPRSVNGALTRPNHRRFLAPVRLARDSRRTARRAGASLAGCGRATAARSVSRGEPAAAHLAYAFCRRVTQPHDAVATRRDPRLGPPHFSTSPGESGPSVPIAIARNCSSALRVV